MKVWIVTGSAGNLKTSLEKDKWGVNRRLKNTWERVAKGDLLLFYVTSPVCGIVGVASVEGKSEENNILWHDEAVVGELYIRTGYYSNQFSYSMRKSGRRIGLW